MPCWESRTARVAWRLAVLVLLGAVANMGVALLCASVSNYRETRQISGGPARVLWSQKASRDSRIAVGSDHFEVIIVPGFGLTRYYTRDFAKRFDYVCVAEAGWPCRSFRGEARRDIRHAFPEQYHRAIAPPERIGPLRLDLDDPRPLPIAPLWGGFVSNSALYGATVFLASFAGSFLRRKFRRRKNRCASCGYPIGSSHVCSECGAHLAGHVV